MSKITKMDKARMQEHLRELSKLAMKANIKHHTVIDKNISQSNELLKMLKKEDKEMTDFNMKFLSNKLTSKF